MLDPKSGISKANYVHRMHRKMCRAFHFHHVQWMHLLSCSNSLLLSLFPLSLSSLSSIHRKFKPAKTGNIQTKYHRPIYIVAEKLLFVCWWNICLSVFVSLWVDYSQYAFKIVHRHRDRQRYGHCEVYTCVKIMDECVRFWMCFAYKLLLHPWW